jgi:opacity protein-like surface antigen
MKKATFGLIAGLAMLGSAGAAKAQLPASPLSVEVRGGAAFPTASFGDRYETGVSYGARAILSVAPGIGVYGGYSQSDFDLKSGIGGENASDRGFNAGLRAALPTGVIPFGPWVHGGVVYNELTGQVLGGDERKLGFEVGGGLEFPLGQRVSVTPGATYTSTSRDAAAGGSANVNYVKADIGLRIRL